jgi:NADH-quinone oxidoreductase subunit N
MDMTTIQPVLPEIIMAALALVVLVLDLFIHRKEVVGIFSIISIAVVAYFVPHSFGKAFGGMFISDGYSLFFKLIFFISMNLTVLLSLRYMAIERANHGEYYALMMFSTLGMMIMASAGDLIILYLGLELMALSTYVLAGFIRHDSKSTEAALKYFLLGAFSSAMLLYGITMIYGLTGTTNIASIGEFLLDRGSDVPVLISAIFILVAFGFKIALVPFHMWAPDVYEGAPTSITAFMSVGPKAAGFAVLGRVFLTGFIPVKADWMGILIALSILTMAAGNILAIQQRNIKRMLAYSSIAHAGYALIGIIACGGEGVSSMANYLFIYGFMNIGAFGIVVMMRGEDFRGDTLDDYKGLAKSHPLAAAIMLIFMFSLTGIPPTAGFVGKFYLFNAAVRAGYTWLAIVAVMFSAVSAYFYLRVVMYMYMYDRDGEPVTLSLSPALGLAILITALMVIFIGIYPSPFLMLAQSIRMI